ncbi:phosphoribosylformylglycinamidine cyclo-ligase [Clostridia bacterium]|nr:phosphoribosylformylglycinamidine cyclo-ligase [Clostridia bacterium]
MEKKEKKAYVQAGVDVKAGYEAVERMRQHVDATKQKGVMGSIGSFGGLFDLSQSSLLEPVLVSGTDGVGTKLLIAQMMDKHDTIGIDCVAMCVNDILAQGAKPLFFLDYIATGKTKPEQIEQIVKGIAQGCIQAGCALIGGETAEMPDMYPEDAYDLAGFAVGAAEKSALIHKGLVKEGDVLLGLPSSGIHSNGYSLVRKIFLKDQKFSLDQQLSELDCLLGEELLKPTRIYAQVVLKVLEKSKVHGISHITGGGFIENLPRIVPEDLAIEITADTWPILPIFHCLKEYGNLDDREMFNIFNMGIGLVLAVPEQEVKNIQQSLQENQEASYVIGRVIQRQEKEIVFVGME